MNSEILIWLVAIIIVLGAVGLIILDIEKKNIIIDDIVAKQNVSLCDRFSGIDKDVCIERVAVAKQNVSLCEKISDGTWKDKCTRRIV